MKSIIFCRRTPEGLPIYQYLAFFSGTLSVLTSGLHYGWPSPTIPKLLQSDSYIPMTNDESSWIVAVFLFGTFCGADAGILLLDRIGRKKTILSTAAPFFISWLMIAFANSFEVLIAARFIGGLGDGLIFCALPMYLGEISNPNIRGFLGSYIAVTLTLGTLITNTLGSYFDIKTTALICSAVPVLLVLTFMRMPESPYYLIMKGNNTGAKQNLKILKGSENVDQELSRLIKAIEEQNAKVKKWFDVFTKKNHRKALLIGMGLRVLQSFCGPVAIGFYAQTIFRNTGDVISPTIASVIYFLVYTLILSFSSLIVDKAGRKPLMIISLIGTIVTLFAVSFYFYIQNTLGYDTSKYSWVPMFTLIAYTIAFGIGMQPVPTIILGELFSTNIKAVALTCCSNSYAVATLLASKFFQYGKDHWGIHVPFFVFALCGVLALLFIILIVPETKGKTLEEIQETLQNVGDMDKITNVSGTFKQIQLD